MNYVEKINSTLKNAFSRTPLVVDLFAGCGGLSVGFEAQGFETHGFEMDVDSCKGIWQSIQLFLSTLFGKPSIALC